MIDTDKYEGCRTNAWRDAWNIPYEELVETQLTMHEQAPNGCTQADLELWADAPLLLAEVKRLREQQKKILEMAELNMALEWGDTDASIEWGAVADIIKGWTE